MTLYQSFFEAKAAARDLARLYGEGAFPGAKPVRTERGTMWRPVIMSNAGVRYGF
jgi:hypothetical protein